MSTENLFIFRALWLGSRDVGQWDAVARYTTPMQDNVQDTSDTVARGKKKLRIITEGNQWRRDEIVIHMKPQFFENER